MAYTTITNAQVAPGAPLTSALVTAFRDNPEEIAAGGSGAPRVVDAALSTSATATGAGWVATRTALLNANGNGTYAIMKPTATTTLNPGTTVAGSGLRFADVAGNTSATAGAGTWRCMGYSISGSATLFLRIA